MRESDIVFDLDDQGDFCVVATPAAYEVLFAGATHSTVESAYAKDADGLSIATARCKYLARRWPTLLQRNEAQRRIAAFNARPTDPLDRDQAYHDKLSDNFREWP